MSEPVTSVSNPKPRLWRRRWFLAVMAVGLTGLFVLFGVLAVLVHPVKYQGTSMEPNLRDGDRLMIQTMVGELKRGDIAAFRYPKDTTKSFIKRIVGLPGETISIDASGVVYINNTELREPYLSPDWNRSPRQFVKTTLAAGEYYVMGDTRDVSNDSRSFGPVERKLIYGKVMWRYWPIMR